MRRHLKRAGAAAVLLSTFTVGYTVGHLGPNCHPDFMACTSTVLNQDWGPQQA